MEIAWSLEGIIRAHLLIERVRINAPTGQRAATEMEEKVLGACYRVTQMYEKVHGPDGEEFAQRMGWISANALKEFLEHGTASQN